MINTLTSPLPETNFSVSIKDWSSPILGLLRELMSELKRFYIEKFEGNVLREFYPEGALKSEAEVKEGKRHGRYREYHENGKLKLRGKYSNNQPKGTWKYYTEEGEFERKEKF